MNNFLLKIGFVLVFFFVLSTKKAHAFLPPDFVFNVGSQIVQIIFLAFTFFVVAIPSFLYRYIKRKKINLKMSKILFICFLIFILGIFLFFTFLYDDEKQQEKEYEKWLAESKAYEREIYGNNISEDDLRAATFLADQEYKTEEEKLADNTFNNIQSNISTSSNINSEFSFFEKNKNASLGINNEDFQKILDSNDNVLVIDIREKVERAYGGFPESTHIRFIDLQAGRFQELPKDQYVYVMCWAGKKRGKTAAEFLRSKKITAQYLSDGPQTWIENGGIWEGGYITDSYFGDNYKKLLSLQDLKKNIAEGVKIIDTREKVRFDFWHIPGSINASMIRTPTTKLEGVFSQVPKNSTFIVACDNHANCVDALLSAFELEGRGHTFIGRYNKIWEYW